LTDKKNALSVPDRKILPESICPTFELLDFIIFRIRLGYGFSDLETGLPLALAADPYLLLECCVGVLLRAGGVWRSFEAVSGTSKRGLRVIPYPGALWVRYGPIPVVADCDRQGGRFILFKTAHIRAILVDR
jgi:hypothetical protein